MGDVERLDVTKIGTFVKTIRDMKGLSQSEVCERCDIKPSYLWKLEENGLPPKPGIDRVQELAIALGFDLPEFLERCRVIQEMSE